MLNKYIINQTAAIWDCASKSKRARLLMQANIGDRIYIHRAFAFIPAWVKTRLSEQLEISQQLNQPSHYAAGVLGASPLTPTPVLSAPAR